MTHDPPLSPSCAGSGQPPACPLQAGTRLGATCRDHDDDNDEYDNDDDVNDDDSDLMSLSSMVMGRAELESELESDMSSRMPESRIPVCKIELKFTDTRSKMVNM